MNFFTRIGQKLKTAVQSRVGKVMGSVGKWARRIGGAGVLASPLYAGIPLVGQVLAGVSGATYGLGKLEGTLRNAVT